MTRDISENLIPSREAARLWGCGDKGFTARMARWGVTPVVRPATARQGGKSNWWRPQDVLNARAAAKAEAAREAAEHAARAAAQAAADHDADAAKQRRMLAALRRVNAMERWRSYYQAKAEARAKAKKVVKVTKKVAKKVAR